jgi:hypothetical protein
MMNLRMRRDLAHYLMLQVLLLLSVNCQRNLGEAKGRVVDVLHNKPGNIVLVAETQTDIEQERPFARVQIRADKAGDFRFRGLPNRTYCVTVQQPYDPSYMNVTLPGPGQTRAVDDELRTFMHPKRSLAVATTEGYEDLRSKQVPFGRISVLKDNGNGTCSNGELVWIDDSSTSDLPSYPGGKLTLVSGQPGYGPFLWELQHHDEVRLISHVLPRGWYPGWVKVKPTTNLQEREFITPDWAGVVSPAYVGLEAAIRCYSLPPGIYAFCFADKGRPCFESFTRMLLFQVK